MRVCSVAEGGVHPRSEEDMLVDCELEGDCCTKDREDTEDSEKGERGHFGQMSILILGFLCCLCICYMLLR
jgi:hypothetical protein